MVVSERSVMDALLLFQLGPVQGFIAQAETLNDLKAGSEMLSEITATALLVAAPHIEERIFPAVENMQGIPNRFLVRVPRREAKLLAEKASVAARNKLIEMARNALQHDVCKGVDEKAFMAQVEQFLQISWAILECPTGKMGEDYDEITSLMALRRNTREFDAWHEEVTTQAKDFLSGKEVALRKGRGAMNLIKCARNTELNIDADCFMRNEKGEEEKYWAVIAMDGDNMGNYLSGLQTAEEHQKFSRQLAGFSPTIEKDEGLLIYSGGDDVLALVNAKKALETVCRIQQSFMEITGKTMSAGIAVGHIKTPLQELVHAAHAAESRAKRHYDRNAVSITVFKRSGEILQWGCKWDSSGLDLYKTLSTMDDKVGGFPYKLARALQPYALTNETAKEMEPILELEVQHVIKQTEGMGELDVHKYLDECVQTHIEDFLSLFLCEAFINRPPKEP